MKLTKILNEIKIVKPDQILLNKASDGNYYARINRYIFPVEIYPDYAVISSMGLTTKLKNLLEEKGISYKNAGNSRSSFIVDKKHFVF